MFGVALFGEILTVRASIGIVLIILAVIVLILSGRRHEKSAA